MVIVVSAIPAAPFSAGSIRMLPIGYVYTWLASIGVLYLLQWIERYYRLVPKILAGLLFAGPLYLTWAAFTTAPMEYSDYGFYGLQIGAPEIYRWIKTLHPGTQVRLADNLFNSTDIFPEFYDPDRVYPTTIVDPMDPFRKGKSPEKSYYVTRIESLNEILGKGYPIKFEQVWSLNSPRGEPLIVAGIATMAPNASAWFAASSHTK
jgi:hypothetical protein